MSAQLVTHVLSYSLGKGVLSLKGRRKRPWLELSRLETERDYLNYQLKQLKKYHEGAIDLFKDRLPTNGFYDKERVRFHGQGLWRAYEILCPRDKSCISPTVLDVVGKQGMASLWIDQGRFIGKRGSIRGKYTEEEYRNITNWLRTFDIPAVLHSNQTAILEISIRKAAIPTLIDIIDPYVPKMMKNKLKAK